MKTLKLFLAVLVGFLLGTLAAHTPTKAQVTHVRVTPVSMSGMNSASGTASGSVVGFSCAADASHPGDSICYVASQ
jgi:hypothetical protein